MYILCNVQLMFKVDWRHKELKVVLCVDFAAFFPPSIEQTNSDGTRLARERIEKHTSDQRVASYEHFTCPCFFFSLINVFHGK